MSTVGFSVFEVPFLARKASNEDLGVDSVIQRLLGVRNHMVFFSFLGYDSQTFGESDVETHPRHPKTFHF